MIHDRGAPTLGRLLRGLLALALACTACTGGIAAEAPVTATPAPGAITLPPRPYDVPIDDIDPCTLLTPTQLQLLQLDGEPDSYTGSDRLLGSTWSCFVSGFGDPNIGVAVVLAANTGVERYTGGELLTDVSPLTIDGFPGVLAVPRNFSDVCNVVIDIAPGQLINIDFSDGGANTPPVPQDQLCDGARRTATEVLRTLLNR